METTKDIKTANDPNPLSLIELAINKGMDIDKLERFFQLQERWEKKVAEKSFLIAFSNFQRDLPEIKKTKKVSYSLKTGGAIAYNYAPLPEIIKQIKKPLSDYTLSYRWEFTENNSIITCTCIISHSDGHSKISVMAAPKDDSGQKNAIQQIGSTHTYLQRYTLIGALGISSAEDDIDGLGKPPQAAMPPATIPEAKKEAARKAEDKKGVIDAVSESLSLLNTSDEVQQYWKGLPKETKQIPEVIDLVSKRGKSLKKKESSN